MDLLRLSATVLRHPLVFMDTRLDTNVLDTGCLCAWGCFLRWQQCFLHAHRAVNSGVNFNC